jgi:predicted RNase H-like HicB family nuclease
VKIQITFTAKLPIQIAKKAKWFVASCPALDVASQGGTEEEAKKNIAEALSMFLRSCYERGTLDAVLKQCGFKPAMEHDLLGNIESMSPTKQEYVDIAVHLLSQFEDNRQCHRA